MKLRDLMKANFVNDGTRTLYESILVPEVEQALKKWEANAQDPGVLVGGLALSFYVKPRATLDVDVLFKYDKDIPMFVDNFRKKRDHAFLHNQTHVEIETLTSDFMKEIPPGLIDLIVKRAKQFGQIKVADPAGLVALKLIRAHSKDHTQDKADIENLIDYQVKDLGEYKKHLTPEQLQLFDELKQKVERRQR